jgi:polyhydroxybutyrate depolymerase
MTKIVVGIAALIIAGVIALHPGIVGLGKHQGGGLAASSTPAGAVAPGESGTRALAFGGAERSYVIHVPAGYDASTPYPLLISFHGNGGTGASQESKTGFSELADANGFIVAYPDSNPDYKEGGQWQLTGKGNDIDFTLALITALQKAYSIDSSRVYLAGHSEGGGLTHALACTHTGTFAGFAVVSTNLNDTIAGACHPSMPITAIYFHGTKDPVSYYEGGNYKGADTWSAPETAEYWVKADGCSGQPSSTSVSDTLTPGGATTDTKQVWGGCLGGTSVTFYTVEGAGHDWPGGTPSNKSQLGPHANLPASQIIWDTLSKARR